MKKVIIVIMVILTLLTSVILIDNSKFVSADIVADVAGESVVHPGDILNFSVQYTVFGKKIKKTFKPYIQTTSSVCDVNDNTVTVSENALTGEEISLEITYKSKISKTFNYIVKYSLDSSIDNNGIVLDPDRIDVLITKDRSLPKDYVPEDLVVSGVKFLSSSDNTSKKMRSEVADALEKLFKAARTDGHTLYGVSAYRSFNTQNKLYKNYVEYYGLSKAETSVAQAGKSEHQTGLAVDITSKSMLYSSQKYKDTKESKWIAKNAYKYGFIVRYPEDKEDVTGYRYEPWHLRYVGINLAKKIYESGLTFDEYMIQ